jgi:hypothetical protein
MIMARYALISNQVVVNVVLLEDADLAPILWPDMVAVNIQDVTPSPSIGWLYDEETGEFTAPLLVEETEQIAPAA